MMKNIALSFLCAALLSLANTITAQQQFTAPVPHFTAAPTGAPSAQGARMRYDLAAGKLYFWNGSTWLLQADGVAQVSGLLPPAFTPGVGQSQFAINAANELYRWRTGTTWDCINCGGVNEPARQVTYGTGSGVDSDANFLRDAGNNDVKVSGDNANLSLRTDDTSGVLSINAKTTKTGIVFNNDIENISYIPPHPSANSGLIQSFGWGRQFFNEPSSSGDNQTVQFGFNVGGPGGQGDVLDPTKPQMSFRMENSFNNEGSYRAYEIHMPQVLYPNVPNRRPISGYYSNDESILAGSTSFCSDNMQWQDYQTKSQKMTFGLGVNNIYNPYNKGITLLDTMALRFRISHIAGLSGIIGRKFNNSADIHMMRTDESDRIYIGGSGETSTAIYNRLNVTNSGTIWNEVGQIFIGDNTNKSRLWVMSNEEAVQSWGRSSASHQSLVLRLDGAIDLPTLASFWTYQHGVKQLVAWDLRSPANSLYINSAGRVGFGTDNPTARLNVVTTEGATVAGLRLQNSVANNRVFATNATPEAAITASPGDVAMRSDGSLWIKETGTGNTGWAQVQTRTASFIPIQKTDASAVNGELYYSTTQNKLCYKDPGGTVNPLY